MCALDGPNHNLRSTTLSEWVRLGYASMVSPFPSPSAHWPGEVARAVCTLNGAPAGEREPARARLWPLLHAALFAALRTQAGRIAPVASEDLEDLASQKALELLLRAEEGVWTIEGRTEPEIAGYLARVARHALVDLARKRGRECPGPEDTEAWDVALAERVEGPARPEDEVAAGEFVHALRECAGALAPRARQAWFRRVFLERPSREIAEQLGLKVGHVDVVVQRARAMLRECMERKGLREIGSRPGLFVELWRHFGHELSAPHLEESSE
jgi:RNA polymerase sigma factor (sigma-70 family)